MTDKTQTKNSSTSVLLDVYARAPLTILSGDGSFVFDEAGRRYLDFGTGIAVNALGHGHPALQESLFTQAGRIWHCSNKFNIPAQSACAARLVDATFADSVFFCNSGAEANEAGLKIMRRRQYAAGHPERWRTIVFTGAFHGRTLATLAATDREDYRHGFGPAVCGFDRVDFNDLDGVEMKISNETAGILLEPIQGDGGIKAFDKTFVQELRALATERDIVLMFDEIQTGVGRTGSFLACEQFDVAPDIVSLAKGLGGGFPIGAVLANKATALGMNQGSHGTTFGGNPLGCAVAETVINEVLKTGFLHNVSIQGQQLSEGLDNLVEKYPSVLKGRRGIGLMHGLQTVSSNTAFERKCLEFGLITMVAADNVVRLLPPLTVKASEISEAIKTLDRVCQCIISN